MSPSKTARHRKQIDRAEKQITPCNDPVEAVQRAVQWVHPIAPGREHYQETNDTRGKGPCHFSCALTREIKRHADAEEGIERRHAREVRGSQLHHLRLAAEEMDPGLR